MIVSIIKNKYENPDWDELHQTALTIHENLKTRKGFVSAISYADREGDEGGIITLWDTMEDIETFYDSLSAEQKEALSKPGVRNIYSVGVVTHKD